MARGSDRRRTGAAATVGFGIQGGASAIDERDQFDELPHDAALMTGEAVGLDLRPTGFVLRAAGTMIDFVVYAGAWFVSLFVLFAITSQANVEDAVVGIIVTVSLVVCLVVAPAAVELLSRGKSLGRLAVGARIVRDDGGAIGFRHAAIRALAGTLEIFGSIGSIAMIVGLLSPRSQRLGDLIAGTYSQYERVSPAPVVAFGMPLPLGAWASVADVARLPDPLSRRIAQFLREAPRMQLDRRAFQASALAHEAAAFVSPVPAVDPEMFLAGVAVIRRDRESRALTLSAQRLARLQPALRELPHGFPERG
ncbi:RDD family protein [Lysinimonas soli]|uniref:RDD family protein n=1 Tax=Lysinimonas soli TaxID=1074233 RepID=A0ABW0NSI9_9MICO